MNSVNVCADCVPIAVGFKIKAHLFTPAKRNGRTNRKQQFVPADGHFSDYGLNQSMNQPTFVPFLFWLMRSISSSYIACQHMSCMSVFTISNHLYTSMHTSHRDHVLFAIDKTDPFNGRLAITDPPLLGAIAEESMSKLPLLNAQVGWVLCIFFSWCYQH